MDVLFEVTTLIRVCQVEELRFDRVCSWELLMNFNYVNTPCFLTSYPEDCVTKEQKSFSNRVIFSENAWWKS